MILKYNTNIYVSNIVIKIVIKILYIALTSNTFKFENINIKVTN